MYAVDCLCQKCSRINEESEWEDVREELKKLHNKCPAVQFLVPNFESWFKNNKEPEPTAFHQSIIVLAFRRGHLNHITSPIHRYCLSGKPPKKQLNKNHEKDLKEAWFSEPDYLKRHKKSKGWMGKMAELKVAEWLEENGWKIEDMEAWGGKNDITTKSADNNKTLIEVKYIGQEDYEFKAIVESIAKTKGVCVTNPNPYVAFNYGLFRIFEAAHQLKRLTDTNTQREAVLVIDSSAWNTMEIPLKWMHGNRYLFFEEEDEVKQDIGWCNFLCDTIKSQKNIKNFGDDLFDMPSVIKALNKITVFKMADWSLEQKMSWTPLITRNQT